MEKNAKLFVNSPNTIDANYEAKCDTASADFQSRQTGNVDYMGEEQEILEKIRELIQLLPENYESGTAYEECEDDLNRICEGIENCADDMQALLEMVSDEGLFFETKKDFAPDMVTGFIRLNGNTVGVVANNANLLTCAGTQKAAAFVTFCDAFDIPVVSFTNAVGFETTMEEEKQLAGASAKLAYAFGNATVPKINVIVEEAFGSAYVVMNSKGLGADLVYAWKEAKIGMMNAESAAKIIYSNEIKESNNFNAIIAEKSEAYEKLQLSAVSAANRGYVDSLIDPQETRKYLIDAVEMLLTKRDELPYKKHGAK